MRQPNPLGCLSHALISHQCVAFEITLPVQFHSQTCELGSQSLANEQNLQSAERCRVRGFELASRQPTARAVTGGNIGVCAAVGGAANYDLPLRPPNHTFEFIFRQIRRVRGGSRRDVPGVRDPGVSFAADISGARS